MFVTAVCFLFLLKLKWPKNKNILTVTLVYMGSGLPGVLGNNGTLST